MKEQGYRAKRRVTKETWESSTIVWIVAVVFLSAGCLWGLWEIGLFDLAENTIHFCLLSGVAGHSDLAQLSESWIFIASVFATLKFGVCAYSIYVIVVLLKEWGLGKGTRGLQE